MTPDQLATIHRAAFTTERRWSAPEFAGLLAGPHVHLIHRANGFALIRSVADEDELLTLAVHPAHQRRGIGDVLVAHWLSRTRAQHAFLEVAADNLSALRLYQKHGFAQTGQRNGYYKRAATSAVDAVLMTAAAPWPKG